MGVIRAIIRLGLKGVLVVWFTTGLLCFWLFGVTERQFLNGSVAVAMVPVRVARVIAVRGFGYTIPDEVLYGSPALQAEEAAKDEADRLRAAAGCSGYNRHCQTPDERAKALQQK